MDLLQDVRYAARVLAQEPRFHPGKLPQRDLCYRPREKTQIGPLGHGKRSYKSLFRDREIVVLAPMASASDAEAARVKPRSCARRALR